jgi:hypothetical protein
VGASKGDEEAIASRARSCGTEFAAAELCADRAYCLLRCILAILRSGGYDERQATDGVSVIFNYLLGAVMIETRRARGGSPSSFELGLRYLITGLKSDPAMSEHPRHANADSVRAGKTH